MKTIYTEKRSTAGKQIDPSNKYSTLSIAFVRSGGNV